MPTDIPSTLRLLLWVAGAFTLLGLAAAVTALMGLRKAKLALSRERTRAIDGATQAALAQAEQRLLTAKLVDLEQELYLEREGAVKLRAQLERPQPLEQSDAHAPSPPGPPPMRARTAAEGQPKLQELESNLAQARRERDATTEALKQSKALAQRRELEISKLASQVDDLALNLEETRILVTEKERQIQEAARDLADKLEAHARVEQALSQARAAIQQRESNAAETTQQLEFMTRQLDERQSAYATLERMLQDATASELQLRRDCKSLVDERGQLEQQNIELKGILDQLGGGIALQNRTEDDATYPVLEPGTWPAVTESDIQGAVVGLQAMHSTRPNEYEAHAASVRVGEPDTVELERQLREAKVRLQLLESGMGDLEYLRDQNARLQDELLLDRGAARELNALQLEHKRLKLDLQLAEQRVSTQAETIEGLSHVASELQDHKMELETLRSLGSQVRDLRAENFALRNANSGTYRVKESLTALKSDARELAEGTLETAVLSDHLGLPVASTGNLPAESLAAVSGIAAQIAAQVRELLPLGPISTVQWVDQYGMTITCKLLKLAGDDMALTALAPGNPTEQSLKQTLTRVLHSIGWTEDGPQQDVTDSAVG